MMLILVLAVMASVASAGKLCVVMVDVVATALAAFYYWRRDRLCRAILTGTHPAARRRVMAKHLQLSIEMAALHSLLPRTTVRGHRLAQMLTKAQ